MALSDDVSGSSWTRTLSSVISSTTRGSSGEPRGCGEAASLFDEALDQLGLSLHHGSCASDIACALFGVRSVYCYEFVDWLLKSASNVIDPDDWAVIDDDAVELLFEIL